MPKHLIKAAEADFINSTLPLERYLHNDLWQKFLKRRFGTDVYFNNDGVYCVFMDDSEFLQLLLSHQ